MVTKDAMQGELVHAVGVKMGFVSVSLWCGRTHACFVVEA